MFEHCCLSVLTPYYTEDVLFSLKGIEEPNEDGVSILFYLQKIYPGFSMFWLGYILQILECVHPWLCFTS